MATVALKVSENFKGTVEKLSWVNWSELTRDTLIKEIELLKALEEAKRIASKSKLTLEDANKLSDKIKESMHKDLKRRGLV